MYGEITHHGTTVGTSFGGIACPGQPIHQMIGPQDAGTEIPFWILGTGLMDPLSGEKSMSLRAGDPSAHHTRHLESGESWKGSFH